MSEYVQTALVLLTGIYVLFTYKILKESRQANLQAAHAYARQFQLACFPHLFCEAVRTHDGLQLAIVNPSSTPALDVEMLVLAVVSEETLPLEEFLRRYLKDHDSSKHLLAPTEDGFYAIYDRPIYSYFPMRRRVDIPLRYPLAIGQFWAFVQFRDILGHNHHRLYWFFEELGPDPSARYRVGSSEPMGIDPSPRLLIDLGRDRAIVAEGGLDLSPRFRREFLPLFASSISSGFLSSDWGGVEDPGEWGDA